MNWNEPSQFSTIRLFDEISPKYDTLNHLFSLGMDFYWRKKLINYLPPCPCIRLLDLATGTGDQIISIMHRVPRVRSALGLDMSQCMIQRGRRKVHDKAYAHRVSFMLGDATHLPLQECSVECITLSFGIRNIAAKKKCLIESYRVLKKGGRLLILEFSIPKNRIIRVGYLFYLRRFLPWIGGIISGHKEAYQYLCHTIEQFPTREHFCQLLIAHHFKVKKIISMTFGIVTLYVGEK